MNNSKKRNDLLLIGSLLLACLFVFLLIQYTKDSGNTVIITQGGQVMDRVSLDTEYEQTFYFGSSYNTVTIHNGQASVTEADCPDQICVKTGKISFDGETIVCLPNKFIVTVENSDSLFDETTN